MVPDGGEAHLFQYSVQNVKNDCKTATIDFDEKCIVENGDFFQNYQYLADDDTTIEDYKIETLNADHELFNVHLGQVNKQIDDLKESKKRKQKMRRSGPPMMCRTWMISFM